MGKRKPAGNADRSQQSSIAALFHVISTAFTVVPRVDGAIFSGTWNDFVADKEKRAAAAEAESAVAGP